MASSVLATVVIGMIVIGLSIYQSSTKTESIKSVTAPPPTPQQQLTVQQKPTTQQPTASATVPPPVVDKCAGCSLVSKACPDGIVVRCIKPCDKETGVCGTCAPDCSEHQLEDLTTLTDTFDGTLINNYLYSTKTTGSGSITQNNEVIQTGKHNYQIIWNVLYTNRNISFSKDFTIEVDINLTAYLDRGDAMAIVGVENRDVISAGQMPNELYCEISTGGSRTILKMGAYNYGFDLVKTSGKLTLSYDAKNSMATCNFAGQKANQEFKKAGQFAVTLRSGLHEVASHDKELPGSGNFTARFDNLNVNVK